MVFEKFDFEAFKKTALNKLKAGGVPIAFTLIFNLLRHSPEPLISLT